MSVAEDALAARIDLFQNSISGLHRSASLSVSRLWAWVDRLFVCDKREAESDAERCKPETEF